jgi:hypothetical protein
MGTAFPFAAWRQAGAIEADEKLKDLAAAG